MKIPTTEEELTMCAIMYADYLPSHFYQEVKKNLANRYPRLAYKKVYFRTKRTQAAICRLMHKKFPGSVRVLYRSAGPPVVTIAGVEFMYKENT